jgi:hypothetical protein
MDSYTVGQTVAVINSGGLRRRHIHKRTVVKVYKNGNFILNDNAHQQWRPSGRKTGDVSFREHVEPWTEAIDAEIAHNQRQIAVNQKVVALRDAIVNCRTGSGDWLLPDEHVMLIEQLTKALSGAD